MNVGVFLYELGINLEGTSKEERNSLEGTFKGEGRAPEGTSNGQDGTGRDKT